MKRVLEPEVMDSPDDARDYDAMDHRDVNLKFVEDLLAVELLAGDVLDLGTGTALIPIELCRNATGFRVMACDLAINMLELARYNIEVNSMLERIQLDRADAKQLPYTDAMFDVVISNSIVHHIPAPITVLREAVRVAKPAGLLFIRDLLRPASEMDLEVLAERYAGDANEHQRQLFEDSLRAALDLTEIRDLVTELGYSADTVSATSDRHWTWIAHVR